MFDGKAEIDQNSAAFMRTALFLMLCHLMLLPAMAQEATAEKSKVEIKSGGEAKKNIDAKPETKAVLEEKTIVYGGFITELSRAEKKSRFLSLRQPRDGTNDFKHIHFDERTARPKGFVLFSIGF
jgi:hypothetical protein